MKTKLNIYTFILILFSFADLAIAQECDYDSTNLNISINGWDIDRTDYTHQKFIEVAGLEQNSQLEYSGEKDTEEFGYPWFYYKLRNSFIHFSGILDNSGNFNGQKRIFLFKIKSRDVDLNVNGIKIGDTLNKLNQTFNDSNFCNITYEGQQTKMIRYEHFTLYFVISSENVIQEIGLNTP